MKSAKLAHTAATNPGMEIEFPTTSTHAFERDILGFILWDETGADLAIPYLTADMFTDITHKALFAGMVKLHQAGRKMMVLTIAAQSQSGNNEEALRAALIGLPYPEEAPTRDHWRESVFEIRKAARRRHIQLWGEQLAANAGTALDPGELIAEAVQALTDPALSPIEAESFTIGELGGNMMERYEEAERRANLGIAYAGLNCGFAGINDKLNGLCPGELTVLAARPSMGKTTLAIQMALSAAQNDNVRVGIFSLEMHQHQLEDRFGCTHANINPEKHRKGRLSNDEKAALARSKEEFKQLKINIYIQDRSVAAMRSRMIAENNQGEETRFWIIDHLHRIQKPEKGDSYGAITEMAAELANLAVELNVPILLLAQLNRNCEARDEKMPHLSDLRDSGAIEEHAVNAMLIYRPGHYPELRAKNPGNENEVSILCEKVRFGEVGSVDLQWIPDRVKFGNVDDYHSDTVRF